MGIRKVTIGLVVIGIIGSVTGCGQLSKSDYFSQYDTITVSLRQDVENFLSDAQTVNVPEMQSFESEANTDMGKLSKLNPPSDVQTFQDESVKDYQAVISLLPNILTDSNSGFESQLNSDLDELNANIDALSALQTEEESLNTGN